MRKIKPFQILKKEYSLSDKDIEAIKSRFIENKIINSDLFIGQFRDKKPTLIIGAPCIRKDIEGVSLNTFYQTFMPLKIASLLKIPCKIFLGIKEEIIFQSKLFKDYEKLGNQLEAGLRKIADELDVNIEIANTSSYKYDQLINKCVEELDIHLTPEESTYLFNLSLEKSKKPLHSTLRAISSKRIIACNTSYALGKLFGSHDFLIVEDIEQHICTLFSRRFDTIKSPNFLAFLPLPNIHGTMSMFKAEKEGRVILCQNKNYYKSILEKSPTWVLNIYKELFDIVNETKKNEFENSESFFETVQKISNYFILTK